MIKGAIYKLARKSDTILGWDTIKILDVRVDRTVTYKTNPQGYVDSDESKNVSTTVRTDYDYICLCDGEDIMTIDNTELWEDLMMNYKLINGGDL